MRLLLMPAALMALTGAATAGHAGGRPLLQEQRNSDGSWLRLTQLENPATEQRTIRVELRDSDASPYAPVLERHQSLATFPQGRGRLADIDGDGLMEIVETKYCGAGPNCTKTIFKVNPLQRKAWRFLHGGFFSIRRIDNFVVTAGRSSCCSWVHQVYRIPTSEREITAQDLAYDITVSGPIEKDSTTARCWITRPEGEEWVSTDVPHQSLRQLCHFYGDDVVINPD
ncbi:hypothetical protein [Synechococcus sp. RS9916]|uniref:hypothetical protein n=1 Tax=Synechococcus sp. RS9916 TaxID=221359 RepID=UPI0000E53E81|nr:hypothetical protein [Synechococcus sp. RS9916]EAU73134.1 hypothetical protein RS9916_26524 [Synechococcus sp. RS9916]